MRMTEDGVRAEVETKAVSFWEAFWFWVKLGFINFGGPAGQIAIMHRAAVPADAQLLHAAAEALRAARRTLAGGVAEQVREGAEESG
jgi:hypothetical protein